MDSTVIQEIADQLGMAVEQAGQCITEHLPEFAAMKAMQAAFPMILIWSLAGILVIVSLVSLAICAYYKREKTNEGREDGYKYYRADWDDFISFYVFAFAGIGALLIIFVGLITTLFYAPDLYGWSNYPEAMLIDMALKAVG